MEKETQEQGLKQIQESIVFETTINDILNSDSNKEISDILTTFATFCCKVERNRVCSNLNVDLYNRVDELSKQAIEVNNKMLQYEELEYIQRKIKEARAN